MSGDGGAPFVYLRPMSASDVRGMPHGARFRVPVRVRWLRSDVYIRPSVRREGLVWVEDERNERLGYGRIYPVERGRIMLPHQLGTKRRAAADAEAVMP